MHPEHRALLEELGRAGRATSHGRFDPSTYLGGSHVFLNVPVPDRRRIAKAWLRGRRSWTAEQVLAVAESLVLGASHEEKTLAALMLSLHPKARAALGPEGVERWLGQLDGWAEVDSLCQNLFTAEELLSDWPAWSALIARLAGDPDIDKRRAALVLLTGPVHRNGDLGLAGLAFETIQRLKSEKPILITKAVSWLLRSLLTRHRAAVAAFLDAEAQTLPAIAVRETRRKLQTGRK
jgi:3-methyladenine DNA glycosylase AlkD